MGECLLCGKLGEYLNKVSRCKESPVFANMFAEEDEQLPDMPVIDLDDIHKDMVCLIVFPEFASEKWAKLIEGKKEKIICRLKQKGIDNYTDCFSYTFPFINVKKKIDAKCIRQWLRPKRIVLGSIEAYSGNIFLRGMLDNHSSIMMISDYHLIIVIYFEYVSGGK